MTVEEAEVSVAELYKISPFFQPGLKIIQRVIGDERPFIFIIDHSVSMSSPLNERTTKRRWDELLERLEGAFDLLCRFPGFIAEIYLFENHLMTVTSREQLATLFTTLRQTQFRYGTPLCDTLRKLFQIHPRGNFIICSDGQATDDKATMATGYEIDNFTEQGFYNTDIYNILSARPRAIFISWWLCSDEEGFIRYLSFIDEKIVNLDLVDDYESEVSRCKKIQMTPGNYYVKSLAAPFLQWMDDVDNPKIGSTDLPPDYESAVVYRPHKTTTLVIRNPRVVQDDRGCTCTIL